MNISPEERKALLTTHGQEFADAWFAGLSEKEDDHAGAPFGWLPIGVAYLAVMACLIGYFGRDLLWMVRFAFMGAA